MKTRDGFSADGVLLQGVARRGQTALRRLLVDDEDASAALTAYLTGDPTLAACLAAASRANTARGAADTAHVPRLQDGTTARPPLARTAGAAQRRALPALRRVLGGSAPRLSLLSTRERGRIYRGNSLGYPQTTHEGLLMSARESPKLT